VAVIAAGHVAQAVGRQAGLRQRVDLRGQITHPFGLASQLPDQLGDAGPNLRGNTGTAHAAANLESA
jgi:hypothetical protein